MKTYTIKQWCEHFGIKIIDNDGFRGVHLHITHVPLGDFIKGITVCTIYPTDKEKYKILDYLIKIL